MTIEIQKRDRAAFLMRCAVVAGERVAALALFALGLVCWVRIVGVFDAPLWRFDRMPLEWKTAASMLAVLYPVAGIGLWMNVSWGIVVWIIAAAVEAALFYGFALGARGLVAAHVVGIALVLALRFAGWWQRRRAAKV